MQIVNRKIIQGLLFLIVFAIVRGGCAVAVWGDVSLDNSQPDIVGNNYEAQTEMGIFGIALGEEKTVAFYTIARHSIGGREVLISDTLPKGTKIKVLGIQKCTSCWPFDWRRFVVRVISDTRFNGKIVVINQSRMNLGNTLWWRLLED